MDKQLTSPIEVLKLNLLLLFKEKRLWYFFKSILLLCISLVAVGVAVAVIISLGFGTFLLSLRETTDNISGVSLVGAIVGAVIGIVLGMSLGGICIAFLTELQVTLYSGKKESLGNMLKNSFERMVPFTLLLAWMAIVIYSGLILLVVPGIIWIFMYMYAPLIMFEEKVGVKEAMRKAKELTSGYKWKLFLNNLVIGLITGLVTMPIAAASDYAENNNVGLFLTLIISLASIGVTLITTPLGMLIQVHYYNDLKRIKGTNDTTKEEASIPNIVHPVEETPLKDIPNESIVGPESNQEGKFEETLGVEQAQI